MGETFTHWWRRNERRFAEGHMTVEQAWAEVAPAVEALKAASGLKQSAVSDSGESAVAGSSRISASDSFGARGVSADQEQQ